jgi:murein hydrolase activator
MPSPWPRLLAAAALSLAVAGAFAEEPSRTGGKQAFPMLDPASTGEVAAEKARRASELRAIEDALAANAEARRRLDAETAELRTDRAKLAAALISATGRARAAEERIAAAEERLDTLLGSETAIRRSLDARRGVIVEVLAVLQRMGRRPPPAVLARPEDILDAVRASVLLGAVIPGLHEEVETLGVDLAELIRLKEAIAADRDALNREILALVEERRRLDALIAARQVRLAEAERSAGGERQRAAELALQAGTLKELIDRMERGAAAAQRSAEESGRTAEAAARETSRDRFAVAAFQSPARLAPKVPFAQARGSLPRPASGALLRDFGALDGYGVTSRGISIGTRPRAVVSSPCDGWIVFAGPFRSLGRLLIINAGDGYYVLLAGMDHISVESGQFVLAGEPVATMGASSSGSPAAGGIETSDPVLYVEFRKDGGSIDPGPWWAKSLGEKVRG